MRRFRLDEMIVLIGLCVASFANANSTARAETSPQDENAVNRQIRSKLVKHTTFDFKKATLEEVVAFLETRHELKVEIDYESLRNNDFDPRSLFSYTVDDTELWNGLKSVLDQNHLSCYLDHGNLKIYSRSNRYTSSYSVADILQGNQSVDVFCKLIQSEIQPTTWKTNGGKADIVPFESNKSIIVSNTQEVHEQVADYLEKMRAKHAVPAK